MSGNSHQRRVRRRQVEGRKDLWKWAATPRARVRLSLDRAVRQPK